MTSPRDSSWRPPPNSANAPLQGPIPVWVRELVRWMDSAFRVPGTDVRVGLDPILGLLLPGAGDLLGSLPSLVLLSIAIRQGVPPVIILRMLLNVGLDSLVGAVPLLGDVFDVAYRSNEKNLALLEEHAVPGRRPKIGDYLLIGFALGVVLAIAVLPLLLVALLIKLLVSG
ncbi:MAG TPA: DUF4112 domain-containing protein [Polyangiaceae bacterium]